MWDDHEPAHINVSPTRDATNPPFEMTPAFAPGPEGYRNAISDATILIIMLQLIANIWSSDYISICMYACNQIYIYALKFGNVYCNLLTMQKYHKNMSCT